MTYSVDWDDASFPEIVRDGPLTLAEAKREASSISLTSAITHETRFARPAACALPTSTRDESPRGDGHVVRGGSARGLRAAAPGANPQRAITRDYGAMRSCRTGRLAGVPVRGAEQARRDGRDVRRAAELHSQTTNQRNGAHMSVRACDGCGEAGADERLWLQAPLGLCAVRVHRVRSCAKQARVARGGGRFVPGEDDQPLPVRVERDERPLRAVTEYAADWRRRHSTERVGP